LGLIVKRSRAIVFVLVGIAVAAVLLWPMLTLELAKVKAIRKYSSDDGRVLNCVPFSSVLSIPHRDTNSGYLFIFPPGCEVGLPKSEFQRDPVHAMVFTNSEWLVACFGTLDKTNYTALEHDTGRTNVFDFISSAYQATVTGISEQRNMTQLRRHLALLLYKATTAPVGFEHSWLQFDRGDFRGFISGDLTKDGKVAIEIYIKQKDEFLTMLIRRKTKAGTMSDVYHILSELTVMPNKPEAAHPAMASRLTTVPWRRVAAPERCDSA
jgi:hypothetical protein